MTLPSRFTLRFGKGGAVGGVVVCGLLLGSPAWLGMGSASAQGSAQASASAQREAVQAYEAGVLLHREGEFEAAVEQYFAAIGLDPSLDRAYAGLTDAQIMAARNRLLSAIGAADEGDLNAAARHIQRAAELNGGHPDIRAAAQSLSDPDAALSAAQRSAFARGASLADNQNWRLAREQFETLVAEAPMYLPARAALHRAAHFENRANTLANEGLALIDQHRLGPAMESLAAAVAIWPYHPDAAEALEQVEARVTDADAAALRAAEAAGRGELEAALEMAQQATAIDRSNTRARRVLRDAQRGLADRATRRGNVRLGADDFAGAREHYQGAFGYVSNYPDARRGMAQAYLGQGAAYEDEGRPGAAVLSYLAGRSHDRSAVSRSLDMAQRRILGETHLTLALDVPEHAPAVGVSSDALGSQFASASLPSYMARAAADDARYAVEVRITDTDIDLRRIRSTQSTYAGSSGYATGYTQWEKRGTVDCTITVTDRATGQVVRRWNADRWATYSDSQQYVVGSTWRRSYWTLPTDDEVAGRLTRELVEAVWPEVREAVTLARARALRDQADAPGSELTPEEALELRVAATLLAAQINEREGAAAMRDLAEAFDTE